MLLLNTDAEVVEGLADKCRALRLHQNMSQQEVAERAGVALQTYRRFEQQGSISLERFVAVVRALNRMPDLEQLLELPPISDLRELDNKPPQRKRAGRKS